MLFLARAPHPAAVLDIGVRSRAPSRARECARAFDGPGVRATRLNRAEKRGRRAGRHPAPFLFAGGRVLPRAHLSSIRLAVSGPASQVRCGTESQSCGGMQSVPPGVQALPAHATNALEKGLGPGAAVVRRRSILAAVGAG